ncbi:GNAT family N-acetyltransferase [Jeotgalibacillus haloalkalitolerans]|uniref:GNAT family N-acetyltransferase n=1 Tax=Jeotgalibacillus haloalkalitolerans TaxID=3104292 RepID=A0ABU5KIX1_9BACL|nr:GNAT family N-acetyltransferase [Jeotgalibacillus sp. HH7-29]MDZ5710701.1 GNAT family N-acetyltransferase [Jeotgalibacillus sp. HH7-29]
MNISIEPLQASHAEDLLQFETENRTYFSSMVPDRGDDYYVPVIFEQKHQALLNEQVQGDACFYLIKDEQNRIIGRMNVTGIDPREQSGSIGYRIGEVYAGKGAASQALQLLINDMQKKGIKKLSAMTTENHLASQKILLKNEFREVVGAGEIVDLNGQKLKMIHFVYLRPK